jgi:hypothetical protein
MANFRYASKINPCPLCRAHKDCRETHDGGLVFCKEHVREYQEHPGYHYVNESGGGTAGVFGIWGRDDKPAGGRRTYITAAPAALRKPKEEVDPNAPCPFRNIGKFKRGCRPHEAAEITKSLGLPGGTARHWSVYDRHNGHGIERGFTIPEWGYQGNTLIMVSHHVRWSEEAGGEKRAYGNPVADCKRGITLLDGWDQGGAIYLVEGASDTIALHAMGLTAIGRPSNLGGADIIARFLGEGIDLAGRDIVVLGENDLKPDGKWPGKDGANSTARQIKDALPDTKVAVAMAPEGSKDVRDWFRANWKPATSPKNLGPTFVRELIRRTVAAKVAAELDSVAQIDTAIVADTEAGRADGDHVGHVLAFRDHVRALTIADWLTNRDQAGQSIRTIRADQSGYHCPRPRCVVCIHRETNEPRVQYVRCERPDCDGCRRYLIQRELISLASHWSFTGQLYELGCDAADWPTVQKRVRRAGGRYARVVDGAGYWVVTDRHVAGSIPIAAAQAVSTLETLLADWADQRPVSTSHAWKLPDLRDPNHTWERIGSGRAGLDAAAIQAVADRYDAAVVRSAAAPGVPMRVMSTSTLRRAFWTRADGLAAAMDLTAHEEVDVEAFAASWRASKAAPASRTLADELDLAGSCAMAT